MLPFLLKNGALPIKLMSGDFLFSVRVSHVLLINPLPRFYLLPNTTAPVYGLTGDLKGIHRVFMENM